jgi:hypothetical protein
MKLLKTGLRFWITLTSLFSFVAGWIMLAHAPKPDQRDALVSSVAPIPTLDPLRPLSEFQAGGPSQDQPFFNFQPRWQRPIFSTGGS